MHGFCKTLQDIIGVHHVLKDAVFAGAGFIAAYIATAFRGIPESVVLLMILMLADYFTGLVVAGVFHRSNKTETGRLESRAGWKGLCRKVAILVLVYISHHIDLTFELSDIVMSSVVIGFCLNELLSLVENIGLMGVPLPGALMQAIELLKAKADQQTAAVHVAVPDPAIQENQSQDSEGAGGAEQAAEVTHHSGTF